MENRKSLFSGAGSAAFIIFEVLVAVIILSIGLTALMRGFHQTLQVTTRSAEFFMATRAVERCRTAILLRDAYGLDDDVVSTAGNTDGYHCRASSAEISLAPEKADEEQAAQQQEQAPATTYYRNTVTVQKGKNTLWDFSFVSRKPAM